MFNIQIPPHEAYEAREVYEVWCRVIPLADKIGYLNQMIPCSKPLRPFESRPKTTGMRGNCAMLTM
jgi:hypothetical protein